LHNKFKNQLKKMRIQKGDTVKYIGSSPEMVNWGANTDPNGVLTKGKEYTVEYTEVHTSHTKLKLAGYEGKFNSVSFMKSQNL